MNSVGTQKNTANFIKKGAQIELLSKIFVEN